MYLCIAQLWVVHLEAQGSSASACALPPSIKLCYHLPILLFVRAPAVNTVLLSRRGWIKMESQRPQEVQLATACTPACQGVSFHRSWSSCIRHSVQQQLCHWPAWWQPVNRDFNAACISQRRKALFSLTLWCGCNIYCQINLWIHTTSWVNMSNPMFSFITHSSGGKPILQSCDWDKQFILKLMTVSCYYSR